MLDKIRQLAMEKLATQVEVDAFMEGFEKAAAMGQYFNNPDAYRAMAGAVIKTGVTLGAGLLGAAIVKGVSSGSTAVSNYSLRNRFDMSLAQVMANNKIIKGARPEKAKAYAETIFSFAPYVAADPNLLSSILANAVLGEGIDPQTIKTLVDLEGRYVDNNRTTNLPGIKVS